MKTRGTRHILLQQINAYLYIKTHQPAVAELSEYHLVAMKPMRMTDTPSLIDIAILQLAQVIPLHYPVTLRSVIILSKCTDICASSHLQQMNLSLAELESLRFMGYRVYASASKIDFPSHAEYTVSLLDRNGAAALISLKAHLSMRVAPKRSQTNERRLMLDICATGQAYKNKQISNMGFVRSSQNLADGLAKPKASKTLYALCQIAQHNINTVQWIIRIPQ